MQTEAERQALILSHANEMGTRFSADKTTASCDVCGASEPLKQIKLHWRGIYGNARTSLITILSLFNHMIHISAYMQADFWTYHHFCNSCRQRIVQRRTLAEINRYVSFVLVLLFGGILALSLLLLIVVVLDFGWKMFGYFTLGFVSGAAGLVFAVWSTMKLDQWCVPINLRCIAKRPFQLYQVHRENK